jgi:hypothetical protein
MRAEFLTPHYYVLNPFIEIIKASETKGSKSNLRSESWNIFFNIFKEWIFN